MTAVLALHGLRVSDFATQVGCSDCHLRGVLLGERKPSERLRLAMREGLAPDEWRFIRGEIDSLGLQKEAIR